MKSILLLLVFVPFISFAQTNTFPSSGSVGIGTTSPQYQLDVSGFIRASQSLYTNYGTASYGLAHWRLTTNNTLRIGLGLITNETGGNQGSDFSIWRYGDDGSYLANSFFIKRSNGYVGIGTANPETSLDVSGAIRASQSLNTNSGTDNYGNTHWRLTTNNTIRIGLGLITNETGGNQGSDFSIWRYGDDGSYLASSFFIKRSSGNVGIGTSNPGNYKLAVEGKIGAREVKVTLENPWADYVFSEQYKLIDLKELEAYIKKNNHLPGIPSATEVKEKGGIELGEMDRRLLEKVEELTLYIIDLKKENEQVKERIKVLEAK